MSEFHVRVSLKKLHGNHPILHVKVPFFSVFLGHLGNCLHPSTRFRLCPYGHDGKDCHEGMHADFEANSGGWGTFWPRDGRFSKDRVGGWSNYVSTLHNVWVSGLFQLDEFEIWSNAGLDVIWMRIYRGTPEIAAIFVKWLVFFIFSIASDGPMVLVCRSVGAGRLRF